MASTEPLSTPRRKPALPRLAHLARRLMVYYLLVVLALMFLEERMLFFPQRYPDPRGEWQPRDLPVEDAHFASADGTKLHGWFLEHANPRAVVLFAPGNAGNLTHWTDFIATLHHQLRVTVMIFDYRGFGRSEGSPNEPGILADARAARAWLARRAKIAPSEIVLVGRSLGGGVMVDLAASDGARGLVLQNTFSSLPDVAAFHYPLIPVRWVMRNRLDSIGKIARYAGPLLQCHATTDEIVPFHLGEQLFAAATGLKQFVPLPGRLHNDALPSEYYRALDAWFDNLPH